ncbi:MAG: GTP 3',8-cyclase MoaA [Spirochaetales bacterium]|nr:GTP 3',8-cyclase MoaA [Spirochaetales bacterium]
MNRPDYLRLSITDRCNIRCLYCRPEHAESFRPAECVLTYEEITRLAGLFADAGVRHIRITGGEPLVRRDVPSLVASLKAVPGIREVTLTTNGIALARHIGELKKAGLDRVNISLDTLKKERYQRITGSDLWDSAFAGVMAALDAGIGGVKVNVVLLKGINGDETADFITFASRYGVIVRFIEMYEVKGCNQDNACYSFPLLPAIKRDFGGYEPIDSVAGSGPAVYYRLKGNGAIFGFINGVSGNFCAGCNRLRMNCTGEVFPCLFSEPYADFGQLFRKGDLAAIKKTLIELSNDKKRFNKKNCLPSHLEMGCMGG